MSTWLAWLCEPDGALSSISMSPTQIATFIHSSHTITPKRLKARQSINRGKFVFSVTPQPSKTPTEMKPSGEWIHDFLLIQDCVYKNKRRKPKERFLSLWWCFLPWVVCRVSRSERGERAAVIACLPADTIEQLIFLFRIQRPAIS